MIPVFVPCFGKIRHLCSTAPILRNNWSHIRNTNRISRKWIENTPYQAIKRRKTKGICNSLFCTETPLSVLSLKKRGSRLLWLNWIECFLLLLECFGLYSLLWDYILMLICYGEQPAKTLKTKTFKHKRMCWKNCLKYPGNSALSFWPSRSVKHDKKKYWQKLVLIAQIKKKWRRIINWCLNVQSFQYN